MRACHRKQELALTCCVLQSGDLNEPLMQQPSPSEQSGYAGPEARQQSDSYIPPGFTVERQGTMIALVTDTPLWRSATLHVGIEPIPATGAQKVMPTERFTAMQSLMTC